MVENEFVRIGLSVIIYLFEEVVKFVFGFNDDGILRLGFIVDVFFVK